MQSESVRHNEILARMHSGAQLEGAYQRVRDINLVSLGGMVAEQCPHGLVYATATEGADFLRSVGEQTSRTSDSSAEIGLRAIEVACSVAHGLSTGHGTLFDFDRWAFGIATQPMLVGLHESSPKPLEVLGERVFPTEVLSFVRYVQRFMGPGTPLELLADDSPRARSQRLRAVRTVRGVEIVEVTS